MPLENFRALGPVTCRRSVDITVGEASLLAQMLVVYIEKRVPGSIAIEETIGARLEFFRRDRLIQSVSISIVRQ